MAHARSRHRQSWIAAALLFATCALGAGACADSAAHGEEDARPRDAATLDLERPDRAAADGGAGDRSAADQDLGERPDAGGDAAGDAARDAAGDAATADDAATAPDAASSDAGWREIRGVIHAHSPYSHDGCDGEGIVDGVVNQACIDELRAAACAAGLDLLALTDHPAYMRDYPFEQILLYDAAAGDTLIPGAQGPMANLARCPSGHRFLILVGYEGGPHLMPLGLHHHVAPEHYTGLDDERPLEPCLAAVAGLQQAGAVVALAHSEEADLSASRIVEAGVEAMEWYNPHGNIIELFGGDVISETVAVLRVLDVLGGFVRADPAPQSDLVFLPLLRSMPEAGFIKWREVLGRAPVTGLLGTDIHRNVNLAGRSIAMPDGDRLDSYARFFRWLDNRLQVEELSPAAVAQALRAGSLYGVFTVFGEPAGFAFAGQDAQGAPLRLGGRAPGPLTLQLALPARPVAREGGATFDAAQAERAELRATLFRTDAQGTEAVRELSGLGQRLTLAVTAPGAYHVEVWITPRHLVEALAGEADLAERSFLWILTNPIHVP